MRRKEKLVLDKNMLEPAIHKSEVCRLALVDDHKPYVVPVSFGFDGHNLYFHSAPSGRKIDILQKNNHVCVEFEQNVQTLKSEKPCGWSVRYFSIIGNGIATQIIDTTEKIYALNQILKHYEPSAKDYPFSDKELSTVLVFKIEFQEIVGKISGFKGVR